MLTLPLGEESVRGVGHDVISCQVGLEKKMVASILTNGPFVIVLLTVHTNKAFNLKVSWQNTYDKKLLKTSVIVLVPVQAFGQAEARCWDQGFRCLWPLWKLTRQTGCEHIIGVGSTALVCWYLARPYFYWVVVIGSRGWYLGEARSSWLDIMVEWEVCQMVSHFYAPFRRFTWFTNKLQLVQGLFLKLF